MIFYSVGQHSIALRKAGFAVLPLHEKTPMVRFGRVGSPPEKWPLKTGAEWPALAEGVAVHCGHSGIVVVDCDPRNGGSVTGLDLPYTMRVCSRDSTPSHWYYRLPPDLLEDAPNSFILQQGIDCKVGNGYVVGPGSTRTSPTAWTYCLDPEGLDPDHVSDLPLAPEWLLDRCRKRRDEKHLLLLQRDPLDDRPICRPSADEITLAEFRFDKILYLLSEMKVGARYDTINKLCFEVGGYIAAKRLDPDVVLARLRTVFTERNDPYSDPDEALGVAARAIDDGKGQPVFGRVQGVLRRQFQGETS